MDIDFGKDLKEGLSKIVEIGTWLLDCLKLEVGRNIQQWKKEKNNIVEVENNNNLEQKEVEVKTNYKNVYQRKDGRWEYVKSINGAKYYLIAKTKDKLIEKIKVLKKEKKVVKIKKNHETIGTWSEKWIKTYKTDIGVTARKRYEGIVKNHIIPFFKDMPLNKITPVKVQEFINQFKAERNREYAYITIKQILKSAYINKKIPENIADFVVKPRKKIKPNKTALSLKEQQLFMEELKSYDEDVQMFMIFSIVLGSRRGETIKFKFEDINKDRNSIHIKGTKTYGSDRRIKISDEMIALLEKNKTTRDNEFYFLRNADYYTKRALEIYETCQIKDKTLHDLRHTCSTNLYYLGVLDKQRQQVLGHSSIVMTNDIYTNLQEDIDKEGLLKLYNNLYYEF